MTLEQIRHELQDRQATAVARATGLHFNTIRRIRDGEVRQPNPETRNAIASYLEARRYKA